MWISKNHLSKFSVAASTEEYMYQVIAITNLDDKYQIIAVFTDTMTGEYFPYKGSKVDTSKGWDICHSNSHWSKEETMKLYIDHQPDSLSIVLLVQAEYQFDPNWRWDHSWQLQLWCLLGILPGSPWIAKEWFCQHLSFPVFLALFSRNLAQAFAISIWPSHSWSNPGPQAPIIPKAAGWTVAVFTTPSVILRALM